MVDYLDPKDHNYIGDVTPVVKELFFPENEDGSQVKLPKKYAKVHTVMVPGKGTYVFLHERVDDKLIKEAEKAKKKEDLLKE